MSAAAITARLQHHEPFVRMAEPHLRRLAKSARLRRYEPGQSILAPEGAEPGAFFIVLSGIVEAAPLPGDGDGGDPAWDLREGDCFPVGALISRTPVTSTYTATESTACWVIPAAIFRELLELSEPFKDFCARRTAELLDRFRRILRAQHWRQVDAPGALDQPLAAVVRREPVACLPDTPLTDVLRTMHDERIGAMIVTDAARRPLGIFTLHDVLDRVALAGADVRRPISEFMSSDVVTLPSGASAQDAALAMVRRGIRHVVVANDGAVCGIVSENDLFSLQRLGMRALSSAIARTDDPESLARFGHDIERLARTMLDQGMAAEQLTQFISSLNDVLTQRMIEVVFSHPDLRNVRYCWLAMGSEGRQEQTFTTDQDNGIIFADMPGLTADETRSVLLPYARQVNQALHEAGYVLCKGDIMAGNPAWCLSLAEWKQRFGAWIDSGTPEALLDAAIFFDFRPLHGESGLATRLRDWLHQHIARYPRFLHQMARNALRTRPPIGLFRTFLVDGSGEQRNTVDMKMNGASPFVDAARIYALQCGVPHTNTVARLRTAAPRLGIPAAEVLAWTRAFLFIQLVRLRHQQARREQGLPMNNRANPYELNELDRLTLKEAFRQARKLQARLALDYQL